jgi:hypothetical protein
MIEAGLMAAIAHSNPPCPPPAHPLPTPCLPAQPLLTRRPLAPRIIHRRRSLLWRPWRQSAWGRWEGGRGGGRAVLGAGSVGRTCPFNRQSAGGAAVLLFTLHCCSTRDSLGRAANIGDCTCAPGHGAQPAAPHDSIQPWRLAARASSGTCNHQGPSRTATHPGCRPCSITTR